MATLLGSKKEGFCGQSRAKRGEWFGLLLSGPNSIIKIANILRLIPLCVLPYLSQQLYKANASMSFCKRGNWSLTELSNWPTQLPGGRVKSVGVTSGTQTLKHYVVLCFWERLNMGPKAPTLTSKAWMDKWKSWEIWLFAFSLWPSLEEEEWASSDISRLSFPCQWKEGKGLQRHTVVTR